MTLLRQHVDVIAHFFAIVCSHFLTRTLSSKTQLGAAFFVAMKCTAACSCERAPWLRRDASAASRSLQVDDATGCSDSPSSFSSRSNGNMRPGMQALQLLDCLSDSRGVDSAACANAVQSVEYAVLDTKEAELPARGWQQQPSRPVR